ncbi:hypothetical protein OG453_07445 [Streptomyces sp. NBC_01381]|uniref:hypothetical protein n=1 Tax=Streptomyces sp. NBC_01381 TaxID=2903845 RepID=UPI00225B5340|nr:hypothetical protein [Streptomyces sp. NBC_01381]MCX4666503.1 hypothetical protein [Streptomyces sp. NBC_01381]
MSADNEALGVLAAAVHVMDPVDRIPLVLLAGTEVTDSAVAAQITNPRCWQDPPPATETESKAPRRSKPAQK